MTRVGTLWGSSIQRQSKVILSVAALNGFELDQPKWDFIDRPEEFKTKFTYGKIPTFEGTDGLRLIEGSAIARYLSSIGTVNLLGSTPQDIAKVDQWVHFAEHEIGGPAGNINGTIYGYYNSFSTELLDKNQERLVRALKYLESHLATQSSGYVALDSLTLADLVLVGCVYVVAVIALGKEERKSYPHVFAHYDKVTSDERVKAYWGKDNFAEVRITEPKSFS